MGNEGRRGVIRVVTLTTSSEVREQDNLRLVINAGLDIPVGETVAGVATQLFYISL